jgi:hypothetical protein
MTSRAIRISDFDVRIAERWGGITTGLTNHQRAKWLSGIARDGASVSVPTVSVLTRIVHGYGYRMEKFNLRQKKLKVFTKVTPYFMSLAITKTLISTSGVPASTKPATGTVAEGITR